MDLNAIKRSSSFWHRLSNIKVLDPDGWDRRHGEQAFRDDWCKPITAQDFMNKLVVSTVHGHRDEQMHYPSHLDNLTCGDENKGILGTSWFGFTEDE